MRNGFRLFTLLFTLAGLQSLAQTDTPKVSAAPKADTTTVKVEAPIMDYNSPKRYIINKIKVNGVKYYDTDILTASSGLQKGDTVYLPGNYISEAINRLWSQRYFSDVKIVAEPVGDSVNLEIYLKERPRVYRWLFDGPRKGEILSLIHI